MRTCWAIFILFCSLSGTLMAKPFDIHRWQTKNGAQVIFYPAMEVPMLDIQVAFAAGSAYDGPLYGLSALTAELLNQGNGPLNADALAEQLAETGAQYNSKTSRDMAVFGLRSLTEPEGLSKASDLFALTLNHPNFPLLAFEREKNQQLLAIKQLSESPTEVANQVFFQALYQNHPYGHPVLGTAEQVQKITLNQVKQFYKTFFVGRNATIVLVGAIQLSKAQQLAEQIVGHLPAGKPAFPIPNAAPIQEEKNILVPFPSSQTVLLMGQLGITHHNPMYFPLLVGNYTLGGGALVSQLAHEIREKRGLTYGVNSQFLPLPGIGPFIISLATANKQAQLAADLTRKTLTRFIQKGPSSDELSAAKKYLVGSFPLSLASNRNIAEMLLKIAFYHLPDNYLDTYTHYISAVSAEQIQQAFSQLISPEVLLEVAVGKV